MYTLHINHYCEIKIILIPPFIIIKFNKTDENDTIRIKDAKPG